MGAWNTNRENMTLDKSCPGMGNTISAVRAGAPILSGPPASLQPKDGGFPADTHQERKQ